MDLELTKHYQHQTVEHKWNERWLQRGYFSSEPDQSKKPFTLVIPPPNVTGVLHLGHTLNETVQDILARRARMMGYNVCWVPGSDHASIATEAKVVGLLKEKGIEKNQLTREEFLQYAYEWKQKYGGIIYSQIKKLGCSVDWNRVTFTMDDAYYKAVIQVFVALYRKGLIYRGARMINWDPDAGTALSDEEVEYQEVEGKLYYIKYYISDAAIVPMEDDARKNSEYVVIATQRPETIMGDTAICANPNDSRYTALRGKKALVPVVNRPVPIIFDDYVDMNFGSGILKITPAHDINDYNLGIKHNLQSINTLNEDGTLGDAAGIFSGLDRFEARKRVVEFLRLHDLLIKEENYATRVGLSQRTHAVVEPRISTQWFVRMKDLAEPALKSVVQGTIKIHPAERFLNTYVHWLENVKDWCISRQLWWGQRIPAWYDEEGNVYVAENDTEALKMAHMQVNGKAGSIALKQDEDVLDTWFSSWLWPIEVFRGITSPGNADIVYYYPTSVLVTGQDIIFFWVARMIMAGFEFEHKKPFKDVYFTGMVRDKQGRKMSKSLGNSPDLLELIEKYGADAVRFGIMIASPAGNDLLFDEAGLEQGRHFNNKLWNALKLIKSWQTRIDGSQTDDSFAVDWFENRLYAAKDLVGRLHEGFKLSESLKSIYSLIWDDFCSWYLEWIKPASGLAISQTTFEKTVYFFDELLQLLHPYMPFITEEIHHLLLPSAGEICVTQASAPGAVDPNVIADGDFLKQAISEIRNLKSKFELNNFSIGLSDSRRLVMSGILKKSVKPQKVEYVSNPLDDCISLLVNGEKVYIETETKIHRKDDLIKDLEYQKGFLESVLKKLNNERFVQHAKPDLIELERKKKASAEETIKKLEEELSKLL